MRVRERLDSLRWVASHSVGAVNHSDRPARREERSGRANVAWTGCVVLCTRYGVSQHRVDQRP
jgi:hypothetical protein